MSETMKTDLAALGNAPKKRGRPAKPGALTAAQRKRLERERAKEAVWGVESPMFERYDKVTTRALCEELASLVERRLDALAKGVMEELAKRATPKTD